MAAIDGETVAADPLADAQQHLASCASCGQWRQELEAMNRRFHGVSYSGVDVDLWVSVRARVHHVDAGRPLTYRLGVIGAFIVGWRAVQLFVDLPFPTLHPIVPLAGATVALWLIARDPLAIETFAPELEKRGV
jgi:hypothetical protein